MDYAEPEIYLQGIHHVQMEGSFGPPVDAAAKLRANSALALARTAYPAALDEVVSLLVDEWPEARVGAVRALAVNGGEAGALLLKLKILLGESEPDVLAECFSGLLTAAPEKSVRLVAVSLTPKISPLPKRPCWRWDHRGCRTPFDLLKARWQTAAGPLRKRGNPTWDSPHN